MLGADLQHVGAMLGEALAARRARQNAREIEHADAGERPSRILRRSRRSVADSLDFEQRLLGYGLRLWMSPPVLGAAHEAGATAGGVDRIFERCAAPRAAFALGFLP